jgi:hypothetical protein
MQKKASSIFCCLLPLTIWHGSGDLALCRSSAWQSVLVTECSYWLDRFLVPLILAVL